MLARVLREGATQVWRNPVITGIFVQVVRRVRRRPIRFMVGKGGECRGVERGRPLVKCRARCGPTPLRFGDNKHRRDQRMDYVRKILNKIRKAIILQKNCIMILSNKIYNYANCYIFEKDFRSSLAFFGCIPTCAPNMRLPFHHAIGKAVAIWQDFRSQEIKFSLRLDAYSQKTAMMRPAFTRFV